MRKIWKSTVYFCIKMIEGSICELFRRREIVWKEDLWYGGTKRYVKAFLGIWNFSAFSIHPEYTKMPVWPLIINHSLDFRSTSVEFGGHVSNRNFSFLKMPSHDKSLSDAVCNKILYLSPYHHGKWSNDWIPIKTGNSALTPLWNFAHVTCESCETALIRDEVRLKSRTLDICMSLQSILQWHL